MTTSLLLLFAGLALVVKGGDMFVAAAIRLATFLRMPKVVVGSTLVSLATTTPELVVSVMAGLRGEPGLAVGNAIGSCLCNIGLILGVTALLRNVEVTLATLRVPLFTMMGAGVLLLVASWNLELARWQGGTLLIAGAGYFAWDFWSHWRSRGVIETAEAQVIGEEITDARWAWVETRAGTVSQFLLGAAIVVFGSRLLVDGAVAVAAKLGIPSVVIGLTVVAVGTSLPELITAINSSRRAVSDLAVGNVLGANIANLTFIVGVAAIIAPVPIERVTLAFHFPVMLAAGAMVWWQLATHGRLTRREGMLLLLGYVAFLVVQMAVTPRG
jgi:cation:H+ antiporter